MRSGGLVPVAAVSLDVATVVAAVQALPGRPSPRAQADALAGALAGCLQADTVTVTLRPPRGTPAAPDAHAPPMRTGGRRPSRDNGSNPAGPAGGAVEEAGLLRLFEGGQVIAELTLQPASAAQRLRGWPELLAAVRLVLSDLRAQLVTADAGTLVARGAALLADARLRAAAEMEQQRYHLERDLHDGAQHHMVALQMSLAMVEHQLDAGDPVGAAGHLNRLRELLASTEEVLRTTATGLLSQPLADHGLVTALSARLDPMDTVTLDIDPLLVGRRYPLAVEATVYLACLEGVSNAHKHAHGAEVTLSLRACPEGLRFEVTDSGPGFDTGGQMPLHHLAARLESVGGTLIVRSRPGEGTRVAGFVAV